MVGLSLFFESATRMIPLISLGWFIVLNLMYRKIHVSHKKEMSVEQK